jgi:hypothetical protein
MSATVFAIIFIVVSVVFFVIVIIAFSYPNLLINAVKFLFLKPLKSIIKPLHHKGAVVAVKLDNTKSGKT